MPITTRLTNTEDARSIAEIKGFFGLESLGSRLMNLIKNREEITQKLASKVSKNLVEGTWSRYGWCRPCDKDVQDIAKTSVETKEYFLTEINNGRVRREKADPKILEQLRERPSYFDYRFLVNAAMRGALTGFNPDIEFYHLSKAHNKAHCDSAKANFEIARHKLNEEYTDKVIKKESPNYTPGKACEAFRSFMRNIDPLRSCIIGVSRSKDLSDVSEGWDGDRPEPNTTIVSNAVISDCKEFSSSIDRLYNGCKEERVNANHIKGGYTPPF